jgi:hypothetical protein
MDLNKMLAAEGNAKAGFEIFFKQISLLHVRKAQ